QVSATTSSSGGTPPAAPTGLKVTGTTSSSVSLSWTAPSGSVTGYHVSENGSQVATVTGTSDTVTGLAASTTYTFTVAAYNTTAPGSRRNPAKSAPPRPAPAGAGVHCPRTC